MCKHEKEIAISIDSLGKEFTSDAGQVEAFSDITMKIGRGEFLCIVGPSGCGKTTMLRCLAEIETPSSGSIKIDRQDKTAMVFQEHGLYPWMTVEINLRFVLEASEIKRDRHSEIIEHFINAVGLLKFRNFYPYQLSGGMNQRIALIRAFCIYPDILLMDEPFVFLDYQNRIILQNLLLKLWSKHNQTIVFVTHNINEAAALADRVLVMSKRPGHIKQELICDFQRPRDVIELRSDPKFQKIVVDITKNLKNEIESEFED